MTGSVALPLYVDLDALERHRAVSLLGDTVIENPLKSVLEYFFFLFSHFRRLIIK